MCLSKSLKVTLLKGLINAEQKFLNNLKLFAVGGGGFSFDL